MVLKPVGLCRRYIEMDIALQGYCKFAKQFGWLLKWPSECKDMRYFWVNLFTPIPVGVCTDCEIQQVLVWACAVVLRPRSHGRDRGQNNNGPITLGLTK
jgi:hypothetical protein